ncbi:MAG: GMC family oxidoreductase [Pseudomonadota bacterium]
MTAPDVIIIGSGMGGATLAAALAPTGKRILILEKGESLRPSPADRDAGAIFGRGHFRPKETWFDGKGRPFNPGNYYNVGGNSKFYGAVLLRYRAEDFAPIRHLQGTTPGWPIGYDDLEPYYQRAETMYQVRGQLGDDPSEPPHSGVYPHAPVPDEPVIADLRRRLRSVGLNPASLPLGVDIDRWLSGGQTTWDAYPNTTGGKMDAETIGIAEALKHPNVTLRTGSGVTRLIADAMGQISGVEVTGVVLHAPLVVLAAGAVQSAVLLLRSGLANASDQVGRNFMNHNTSAVLAIHPFRKNPSIYQKTLMVNDFYLSGGPDNAPLGNIQLLGKITGPILASQVAIPKFIAGFIARRTIDLYAMSEDLPDPDSRIMLQGDRIVMDWRQKNWAAHLAFVAKLKGLLRRAGYPIVLSRPFDSRTPSHQCGTARMGRDPATSVVDRFCRSHDHRNLFITDASVLPTSAAVNPALTVAALALRAADHIKGTDFAG